MAEQLQRGRLYDYYSNSNLVLESERTSRREEGTTDVSSIAGKIDFRMGDKMLTKRSSELDDKISKAKAKRQKSDNSGGVAKAKSILNSKLGKVSHSLDEEMDAISYKPKTKETRLAYEEFLNIIQQILGDQPNDIIWGAADEVIAILKDDNIRDSNKQKEVEKLLGSLDTMKYTKFVQISKKLTDFAADSQTDDIANEKMDDDIGVAVIFDEDEDEDEDIIDDRGEDDEDDEDDDEERGEEAKNSSQLRGAREDRDEVAEDKFDISVHEIDAHWLQRQLSKYYPDANTSSKLADETLNVLNAPDERSCENRLVVLLDFDKFDLIKLLLRNRHKVYFCSKYRQAQNDEEKESVKNEMLSDPSGRGERIFLELSQKASADSWTQDRIGEFALKARREARLLNRNHELDENDADGDNEMALFAGKDSDIVPLEEKRVLDMEFLKFKDGAHVMTNKSCVLPEKSWRATKKGYEEVHVPAIRPIIPPGETLVSVSELPDWCQPVFDGVSNLNRIQSKMVNAALKGSENILLCAPTGAGKTNVALLCMLNQIGLHRNSQGVIDLQAFKIVYVAPMKALVQECVLNFGKRLAPLGINVRELSGDQNLSRQQIQDTQVIVTTPEKWDIITRKSSDRTYTQLVKLMIIDEIHLLHDDRGPVLESIVARALRQIETTQEMVRFVGLSATLPNFEDVAAFLRVNPERGLFFFDNSFRPVPLQQQYIGITEKKAIKRYQLMSEICYEKVLQHAGRNQILIFTHSRADTVKTAKALRDMALENETINQFVREDSATREILRDEAEQSAKSADLKDLLPYGFAVHHAGLSRVDRNLVEDLFAAKHVQVLVSTATLAWGVNLPCHTVILKGTQMYSPEQGRWVELSPLDVMQMMGRAGRYGLDTEGEGIIITNHSELQYYLSLMNQQLPIESQLISRLPDMLNAEIVLGNVSSVREAASWLGYSYLYIRMLRNPSIYGLDPHDMKSDPSLLSRRIDLVHTAATLLEKHGMVKYDRRSGYFQSTPLGRVGSYYYVSHDTMNTFNEYLKPSMNEIEIFRLFSISGEFQQIHVREEEKIELSKLVSKVPIPIKESIDEPSAKINVLLQAYISRLKLEGFSLAADMIFVQQSACRIMRALFEISLKKGWAGLANRLLNIAKMVERRLWSSQSPLRQFSSIPDPIIKKLERCVDIRWEQYSDLKPQDLGEMVKAPKMANALYKYVHMFPKMEISAHFLPITRSLLKVELTLTADFQYDVSVHDAAQLFWIFVEDVDGEKILHTEPFLLRSALATVELPVSFFVPLSEPIPPQYFIRVVSDRWLHCQSLVPVSFRHLILPQRFPPSTQLLDLQPMPLAAIDIPNLMKIYGNEFKTLNAIQTQVFPSLCKNNESLLICGPSGSGKKVCAEIAMMKFLANPASTGKILYVAPHEDVVLKIYRSWQVKFGKFWEKDVCLLQGDLTADLALMENSDIIVSSVENWDLISRRWKLRKVVHQISLAIFDDLHMVGSSLGPTYEIIISRTRYMASQLEKKLRILGLSSSLANAKDIGDWIGAPSSNIFNFPPSARPVPLELHFITSELYHAGSRLLSMAKPVFNIILKNAEKKPVIVYVPTRKQSQLTAIDLMSFALASGMSTGFFDDSSGFKWSQDDLDCLEEVGLKQSLQCGVGYLHKGLSMRTHQFVHDLFRNNILQVLVVPFDYCWKVPCNSYVSVVMDTMYFDGREHRYVDYNIADVLRMLGNANRPQYDNTGRAFVMCHSSKKEYLKKLILEPLPMESHMNHFIHDHLNSEIVTKTIENKQDAVDFLTWTFYYRRLFQNPNYYNLDGVTHKHISDHLSELIEAVTNDLEMSKCISVDDDFELSPLNLGMIASYYYIQYTTLELFASSLTAKTKIAGVLEIICASTEFGKLAIRNGEEKALSSLWNHLPKTLVSNKENMLRFDDPSTKALVLLQAHFCREPMPLDMYDDLKLVLKDSVKLLQAMVDVLSSQGWLKPALAAMEVSQMIMQGLWDSDSPLLQIPHVDSSIVQDCAESDPPVETVFDVIDLEDDVRKTLLRIDSPKSLSDIAKFCNAFPSLDLKYELSDTEVCVKFDTFQYMIMSLVFYWSYDDFMIYFRLCVVMLFRFQSVFFEMRMKKKTH